MPGSPLLPRRAAAVAVAAAVVPLLWSGDWRLGAVLSLLSVPVWLACAVAIAASASELRALALAGVLGLASPLLGCALGLLLMPLLGALALLGWALGWPALAAPLIVALCGPAGILAAPEQFFPVGLGMGLLVFALVRARPSAAPVPAV